jgi:hypothetical protein
MLRQDMAFIAGHSGGTKQRIDVECDRLNAVVNEAPVAVFGAVVQAGESPSLDTPLPPRPERCP